MSSELIDGMSKEARLSKAVEMRLLGKSLDEISEQVGYSRMWVCKLLKKSGCAVPKITYDKNGSARTKHGMRFEPEYYSWYSMKTRCGNPNHNDYKHWGARGITYDPRWECFLNFYEDMGARPSKAYTLERKDNNGNYCKENCIWVLKKHQQRNQRTTVLNEDKVIAIRQKFSEGARQVDLAKEYGIRASHVSSIIKRKCWKDI